MWLNHADEHTPVPTVPAGAWQNAQHYDVVVVGAGMGGLYTAWKLEGKPLKVGVFERTHHIGGRARSDRVDGSGVPFDLGAMRFIPSQHVLVNSLVQHFNMPTHEFVVGGDKNLQYFRGVRLTNQEVAQDPTKLPFNLASNERGKTADQLLAMAIQAVVPHFDALTPQQWEDAKRNTTLAVTDPSTGQTQHVPLYQFGLQNVLARTLSREAQKLVMDSVGYQSFLQNWDAGQALQGLAGDFKPGTEYRTPDEGMKAFPKALAGELKQHGTQIHTENTLRQVNWDADKKQFNLIFEDSKGKPMAVVADKLVLDLPKVPLQALVADSPALQSTPLEANLSRVTANPMSRIFVAYDKPWWHDDGIQAGRSLTDLQLG
ncbi:MAG: flavin monoamine oxidase family protein, partial [Candidatus Xenobia bacterium]